MNWVIDMTLTLEVDAEVVKKLEEEAAAAGESLHQYAESVLLGRLADEDRKRAVDYALEAIGRSGSSLGRDGRPWRELAHEGHKY
jgi:hypothetical protein